MLKLSKSAIEEIAKNTNAPIINRMTEEEQAELKKSDSPSILAFSFSKVNGVITSSLYVGKSGKLYYELGQNHFSW